MARIGTAYIPIEGDFDPLFRQIKANLPKIKAELSAITGPQIEGTVDVDTTRATEKIDKLGSETVTVKGSFDLDTSAATAKIELLKREAAGIGGGIGGGVGGFGGGGSGSSGIAKAGFIASNPLITAIAAGLPLLPTVGASLVQGTLGAGALGAAGAGAGAVGFGSVFAAAKPAATALSNLTKAQEAYNTAIKTYGKDSTQATTALAELNFAQSQVPKSGKKVADMLDSLSDRWSKLAAPAQTTFFKALQDGLKGLEGQLPLFANAADKSMTAARGAFDNFLKVLDTQDFHDFVHTMTDTFAKSIGPLTKAFENLARIFMRIAVAAAPAFVRMAKSLREMTGDWLHSTDNAHKLRQEVNGLIGQFKNWMRLIGAVGNVLAALFITNNRGAKAGGEAIKQLTRTLNGWADWITHHHREVNQFFINVLHTVETLAGALGSLATSIAPLSEAFVPISNAILKITTALNSLKVGNVSALTVLLGALTARGIAGKIGRLGAAGAGAEGAAGAGVLSRLLAGAGGGSRLVGGGAIAGAVTEGLGVVGGAKDIAGGSVGHAIGDIGLHAVLGPGSFVARGLRELPVLGGAVGGVEDHVSSLAHKVPVLGGAFDDLFGSGGPTEEAVTQLSTFAKGVQGGNRAIKSMQKQVDGLSTKSASDAINSLKDHYGSLVNAGAHMSAKQRQVWIDIALQARKSGDISQRQLEQLTNAFTNSSAKVQAQMKAAAKVTGESTKQIANSVGNASVHVSKAYDGMVKVVGGGLNWLTSNTSKAAQALGVKQQINFHTTPIGGSTGSAHVQGTVGNEHLAGLASGGMLVPGAGVGDKVPLSIGGRLRAMIEPGEIVHVLNRNAAAHMQALNEAVPRFAKGGYAWPFGSGAQYSPGGYHGVRVDEGVDFFGSGPVFAMGAGRVVPGNWGFPGVAGLRLDLAGGAPKGPGIHPSSSSIYMYEGVQAIKTGLVKAGETIGRMVGSSNEVGFSTSSGQPIAQLAGPLPLDHHSQAGEAMWAFLQAIRGNKAIGSSGAAVQKIARLMLHGPDGDWHLRKTGQAALDKVWNAGKSYLAKHQPKFGGALSGVGTAAPKNLPPSLRKYDHVWAEHMAPDFGGPTMPFNKIAELAEWAGRGRVPGVTMAQVTKGESGSRPGSAGVDPGGTRGYGLWAITTGVGNDAMINALGGPRAMLNPIVNAQAMAKIYEGSGLGAWYGTGSVTSPSAHYSGPMRQKGGMVPWFGNGADFIANRPQVIGVGDGGPERVRVTPADRSRSRYALTITNWQEGTGYMEEVADGVSLGNRRLAHQKDRMRR